MNYHQYKSYISKDPRSQKLIFNIDDRNHYVYRISDLETGKHYYGSRVTNLNPKDDIGFKYFSSSSNKEFILNQKDYPERFKYKILRITNNPGDNILFESYLHQYFQVSSHRGFLNQTNQTPFGWSNTGNKDISNKTKETKSKIDAETGLTGYQLSRITQHKTMSKVDTETGLTGHQKHGLKRNKTLSKIDTETGLTGHQECGLKRNKTLSKIDPETGLTGYQKSSLKMSETKSKVDPETCLTIYQLSRIKRNKTLSKVDPETGLTGYQKIGLKMSETRSKVDPEIGLTGYQKSSLKMSETKSKVDPESGLTGYQKTGLKITGKNHNLFSGYYIYNTNRYVTAGNLSEETGISAAVVRLWCKKNNLKILTNRSYIQSKFLQSLGSREEIVGKTPRDLGFSFEQI